MSRFAAVVFALALFVLSGASSVAAQTTQSSSQSPQTGTPPTCPAPDATHEYDGVNAPASRKIYKITVGGSGGVSLVTIYNLSLQKCSETCPPPVGGSVQGLCTLNTNNQPVCKADKTCSGQTPELPKTPVNSTSNQNPPTLTKTTQPSTNPSPTVNADQGIPTPDTSIPSGQEITQSIQKANQEDALQLQSAETSANDSLSQANVSQLLYNPQSLSTEGSALSGGNATLQDMFSGAGEEGLAPSGNSFGQPTQVQTASEQGSGGSVGLPSSTFTPNSADEGGSASEQAYNTQLTQQASTFTDTSCGWTCTLGNYADSAWDATKSAAENVSNYIADSIIAPSEAQPYNPTTLGALQSASNIICADRGCDPQVLAQALGGTCGAESNCNSAVAHTGSQYQGLGQMSTQEEISATENLSNLAQSQNLTADQRSEVGGVVNQINDELAAGEDPRKDPTLGAWLLAGRQVSLPAMGNDVSPVDQVDSFTSNVRTASDVYEAGQIAPAIYARNGAGETNVLNPTTPISSATAQALQENGIRVSTGDDLYDVIDAMNNRTALSQNIQDGISWAAPVPLPPERPETLASADSADVWNPGSDFTYETSGSVPTAGVPLPPENPLDEGGSLVAGNAPEEPAFQNPAAPEGLSGGSADASDLSGTPSSGGSFAYSNSYFNSLVPTPDVNYDQVAQEAGQNATDESLSDVEGQVPPPDTSDLSSGQDLTAQIAQQNAADASNRATAAAQAYTQGLANQEIEAQVPVPDTSIQSGEAVTQSVQDDEATQAAQAYTQSLAQSGQGEANLPQEGGTPLSPEQSEQALGELQANQSPASSANSSSVWSRLESGAQNTWDSLFGGGPAPLPASPTETVTSEPLPPATDVEAEVPTPNTSELQSGQDLTTQIAQQNEADVQAQIPPPPEPQGPGTPTYAANQYTENLANQELEAQVPVPNTSIQSGEAMTQSVQDDEATQAAQAYTQSLAQSGQGEANLPQEGGTPLSSEQSAQEVAELQANQSGSQSAANIASQIPTPDTSVQSGKEITNDVRAAYVADQPTTWQRFETGVSNTWNYLFGSGPSSLPASPTEPVTEEPLPPAANTETQTTEQNSPLQSELAQYTASLAAKQEGDFAIQGLGGMSYYGPQNQEEAQAAIDAGNASNQSGQTTPSAPPVQTTNNSQATPQPTPKPPSVAPVSKFPQPVAPLIRTVQTPTFFGGTALRMPSFGSNFLQGSLISSLISWLLHSAAQPQSPAAPQTQPPSRVPVSPQGSSTPAQQKPVAAILGNPSSVFSGGTAELSWSSVGADRCIISGAGERVLVDAHGSTTTPPLSATTEFTATCSGEGATSTASTIITVQ